MKGPSEAFMDFLQRSISAVNRTISGCEIKQSLILAFENAKIECKKTTKTFK